MFRHEGPDRSPKKNVFLAAYLALVAGFVNSGGFVIIGSFTSHVTGSVARLGDDLARRNFAAAVFAVLLIGAFFFGSFAASIVIETRFRSVSRSYAWALLFEGLSLALFVLVAALGRGTAARTLDAEAAILCYAMGMQNSLVTRLSGAVVRTTHLTGVVTDLGIEAARWYRWHRAKLTALPVVFPVRQPDVQRPQRRKLVLLCIIVVAFTIGAAAGATVTLRTNAWAMALPALAILAASSYGFVAEGDSRYSRRPPAMTRRARGGAHASPWSEPPAPTSSGEMLAAAATTENNEPSTECGSYTAAAAPSTNRGGGS